MKRSWTMALSAAVLALALYPAPASAKVIRTLTTDMSGAEEAPTPGDPDGTGFAVIELDPKAEEVCFELTVSNITPAFASHIHEGPPGQAGPIVVTLSPPPTDGDSSGCVSADEKLIKDIRAHPFRYYVNVHTLDFPNGAVRGQLGD
jgi:hypothetical protein